MRFSDKFEKTVVHQARMMSRSMRQLIADKRGYVAITFAISALPMIGLAGMAVDYGMMNMHKARMQSAADQVVIVMARKAARSEETNQELSTQAQELFMSTARLPADSATVTVAKEQTFVSVNVGMKYKTNFARMIGYNELDIGVSAKARVELTNVDYFVLMDNTPSMLLGATQEDIDKMNEDFGCAFACHRETAAGEPADSYSQVRAGDAIRLRFDAIKDAVSALADHAKDSQTYHGQYRVGLWHMGERSFGGNPSTEMHLGMTDNMDTVAQAALTVPPMLFTGESTTPQSVNSVSDQRGHLEDMDHILALVRATDPFARQQVLVMVTDGVAEYTEKAGECEGLAWNLETNGDVSRCFSPMPVLSVCQALKNRGVRIAILLTKQVEMEDGWRDTVEPYADEIEPNAKACASPGLYTAVDIGDNIDEAMKGLFNESVKTLRLSNN